MPAISAIKTARWRKIKGPLKTSNAVTIDARMKDHLQFFQADLSMRVLADAKREKRFPNSAKDYVVVVDRKHNASEYKVRYGGKIMYLNNTQTLSEVLDWIAEKIILLSPVGVKKASDRGWRTEHYQDAHLYMVDGKAMQKISRSHRIVSFQRGTQYQKHVVKKNSTHQFTNTMVYARRIEFGGVTTQNNFVKPWSMVAPSGVYKKVANAAKARFGGIARIEYKSMQLSIGATIYGGTKNSFSQFYPTIIVRPRSGAKLG